MYNDDFLTDAEMERLIGEQIEEHGSVSESDTLRIVGEMNAAILGVYLVDAWRGGYMRAFVRDGEVVYALTAWGAEQFDHMRNEDR